MSTVKIEQDVFIRNEYGSRVRVFVAGTEVEESKYNAVVNPEAEKPTGVHLMENKMLPESEEKKEVEVEQVDSDEEEEPVKEVKENKPAKTQVKAKK